MIKIGDRGLLSPDGFQNDSSLPHYSREEIGYIASRGKTQVYKKGQTLLHEGEESDSMYVILAGNVRLFSKNEIGKEVVFSIQGPGTCLDEISLLNRTPNLFSATALEDTALSEVKRKDFESCLQDRPEIAQSLFQSLAQRVSDLTGSVKNFALNDVSNRIKKVLTDLSGEKNGELVVEYSFTHKELSLMVGASREMVSKAMKKLQIQGFVESRGSLTILHPEDG